MKIDENILPIVTNCGGLWRRYAVQSADSMKTTLTNDELRTIHDELLSNIEGYDNYHADDDDREYLDQLEYIIKKVRKMIDGRVNSYEIQS